MSDESDPQAGRTVWFRSSDEQIMPRGDQRYRVQSSVKFYVVQLGGSWVNVSEYGERVLHRANRQTYVTFEKQRHQVRRSGELLPLLEKFVRSGVEVYVGGVHVNHETLQDIEPWPFIYIAPKAAWAIYKTRYLDKR